MDLFDAIFARRSIRKFKPDPVPEDLVRRLVEAACAAPSPGNAHNRRFMAVSNRETLDKLKDIIEKKIQFIASNLPEEERASAGAKLPYLTLFSGAPLVIVVLTSPYVSKVDETLDHLGISEVDRVMLRMWPGLQGTSAAIENLLLAATALGLGSCWMTGPNIARPDLEKFLSIEPPFSIAAFVAAGYPDETPGARKVADVDKFLEFRK